MDLWTAKVLAMCLLFFILLIWGLLPVLVGEYTTKKGEKGKKAIRVLTCFEGGVFFGAYLWYLSPGPGEVLEKSLLKHTGLAYPISELIIGVGFFAALCLEKFVSYLMAKRDQQLVSDDKVKLTGGASLGTEGYDSQRKSGKPFTIRVTGEINPVCVDEIFPPEKAANNGLHSADRVEISGSIRNPTFDNIDGTLQKKNNAVTQMRTTVLFLALFLNCTFKSLTLGQMTTNAMAMYMFASILSHEILLSFCLGLELCKLDSTTGSMYCYCVPVGIFIRIIFGPSNALDITSGVLTAMAAGSVLYITFFGLLGEELRDESSLLKLLGAVLGFLLIAGLAFIPGHENNDHDHDHDHGRYPDFPPTLPTLENGTLSW